VIRFTRERLLSMRRAPGPDDPNPPEVLKHIEGTSILSPEPQDPGMSVGLPRFSLMFKPFV
jgi:hypothetical protein